jgi:hypothetical protein
VLAPSQRCLDPASDTADPIESPILSLYQGTDDHVISLEASQHETASGVS